METDNVSEKDIVSGIGKVKIFEDAIKILKEKTNKTNFSKLSALKNEQVILKLANSVKMCSPQSLFINTGSSEDKNFVRNLAIENKEEAKLSIKDHTIHYDLKEEQGRIVDRTFYIVDEEEKVSSLAQKVPRNEAFIDIREKMSGIMRDKIMIAGFYIRGPIGADASNPAIEITSSAYVAHSADMLYRNLFKNFDNEIKRLKHLYTNIHSQGLNRPEDLPNARVYMDRKCRTTYSINCTYAGNTLLLKKGNHRFSVDKAVYTNRGNELSEHMFITGLEGKKGRITWIAGAAPSGCGKTTTAMAGTHFVGDDLAQMWIDDKGIIKAINPESGIFGIVEDVNYEGDPILMDLLRNEKTEVIWSNVLIDENGKPHWTGNLEKHSEKGINFYGRWIEGMIDEKGKPVPISHPNARVTIRANALSNCSKKLEDPDGVEIRIITYSGRDGDTMPSVWVAKDSDSGVAIGASIVSAATAAEVGAKGVKRAPWANAQFIPGDLADYLDAQFKFFGNKKINPQHKPIIAGLNYFLTRQARGGEGKALLGEKRDVKVWLGWLEARVHNEVEAIKTPIGYIPRYEDLKTLFKNVLNKEYPRKLYDKQFSFYIDKIVARIDLQIDAYKKETNISEKLFSILNKHKEGLLILKERYGAIVTPLQIESINL
ncbi:MAG: phosphoenolpyruvate carboxykinase (GTP) [Deltaproteobacteria bacterium]|nr:phosphoenolpyruvate carboxykinase (GTP) [Deltaproteobacteria bacterium]